MSEEQKTGKSLGLAIHFYRRNPTASIKQVSKALGISESTVARARAMLVEKGELASGRSGSAGTPAPAEPDAEAPAPDAPPPPKSAGAAGKVLDAQALQQLAAMTSMLNGDDDEDDEEVRKRLIRGVKRIAFDITLHPDTRMTASQVWIKLKDMARAKELGPGKPLTIEDAKLRLRDLHTACGLDLSLEGLFAAYNVEDVMHALYRRFKVETPNASVVPADASEAAPSTPGATEAPGGAPDVRPAEDGGEGGVGRGLPADEHPDQG